MKITIIYGNQRKESTYHCVQIIKETIKQFEEIDFTEFSLPKDMPNFCMGCFNCFLKGEEYCPHNEYLKPIVSAMLEADGLILSSPCLWI